MKRRTKHTQRKTGQKRRSSPAARKFAPLQTVEQFFAMPESSRETLIGVANAVSKMRADRISLTKASREFGVSPRTVKRLAAPALRKLSNGQYAARPNDRIFRVVIAVTRRKGPAEVRAVPRDRFTRYLQIPGPNGPIQVTTKESKEATELAAYVSARAAFLRSGDESTLQRFQGKKIGGHALVTDPKLLTAQAEQGDSYDQLYSSLVA